jgi:hypothetical protein
MYGYFIESSYSTHMLLIFLLGKISKGFLDVSFLKASKILSRFFIVPLANGKRLIGPASHSLYPRLPPALHLPGVDASPALRLRLSDAFSSVHMLERHAIVTSYLQQRSYWELKDDTKYNSANLLYITTDGSPYQDLRLSFESVRKGWELRREAKKNGENFKERTAFY